MQRRVPAFPMEQNFLSPAGSASCATEFACSLTVRHWPEALRVGLGALVGGYLGARIGKKLPPSLVKYATVLLAAAMTLHFFLRAYS